MGSKNKFVFAFCFGLFTSSAIIGQNQCTPAFTTTSQYTVNGAQLDIITADFNNDGNLDLATANPSANCVTVSYGSANGTFTTITNFTANVLSPYQLKSADFNGDGKKDLVMTNSSPSSTTNPFGNQFTIMLGVGSGSFSAATNYTVANNTHGILTEDFNSDSKTDLLLSNGTDIKLLLGTGTGSFTGAVTYTCPGTPRYMVSKDFNGDGNPDVAVSTQWLDIVILLGDGAGSFNYVGPVSTSPRNNMIIGSDDFNQDGKWDLVVATTPVPSTVAPNTQINVFLGQGNGGFVPASINPNTTGAPLPTDITTADFNLDGKKDMIMTFVNGAYPLVLTNNGNNTFYSGSQIGTFQDPRGITSGDFNLDGKPDVAIANYNGYPSFATSVYLNTTYFPPVTASSSSSLICAGESVTLTATGANTYTWNNGQDSSMIVANPNTTSTYTVRGTANNGCVKSYTIQQDVQSCEGITSQDKETQLSIFPNPATHEVNITTEGSAIVFISLTNSSGEIVRASDIQKRQEVKLDLNSLKAGLYVVTIKTQENSFMQQKIIIQN